MNVKAQVNPVLVILGLVFLFVSIVIVSLLGEPMQAFMDVGIASSDAHGDAPTSFIIRLIPFALILFIFLAAGWFILTGGGGQE